VQIRHVVTHSKSSGQLLGRCWAEVKDSMTNLTVGSSSVAMRLVFDKLRAGEDFMVIDPKASTYQMSKTKAKKRLMAAGLRPSEANALVRKVAGSHHQGKTLRAAMRHHERHGREWFPWDTLISFN